jgi:two-component system response regulator (stage 0 sporulation protein A)
MLYSLGVPRNLKGYKYIKEAVAVYKNHSDISMMDLYDEVSKKFNTTDRAIERDIRYAISYCWNCNQEVMINFFGGIGNRKPTNANFIATICDKIN